MLPRRIFVKCSRRFTAVHYHGRRYGIEGFVMRRERTPTPSSHPRTGCSLSRWSISQAAALAVALFGIIVVNVAGQGLLPPSEVRRLGLGHYAAEHKAELAAPALKVTERRLKHLAAGREIPP
jgi:hypothetical protein